MLYEDLYVSDEDNGVEYTISTDGVLTIFDGTVEIPDNYFADNPDKSEIKEIVFPESLERIGNYAFSGCESLSKATIPENVKEIGGGAFEGCYDAEITLEGTAGRDVGYRAFENEPIQEGAEEDLDAVIASFDESTGLRGAYESSRDDCEER